jgi:hypothetical protein
MFCAKVKEKERKRFFFEKKKQKTFIRWVCGNAGGLPLSQKSKSFLLLFFKKEALAYFLNTATIAAQSLSSSSGAMVSAGVR